RRCQVQLVQQHEAPALLHAETPAQGDVTGFGKLIAVQQQHRAMTGGFKQRAQARLDQPRRVQDFICDIEVADHADDAREVIGPGDAGLQRAAHWVFPLSARKASRRASSHTSTPSSLALSSLEPASVPATTKLVFLETLPATLAPSASSRALASSRFICAKVPVSTTVLPSSTPSLCWPVSGVRASSSSNALPAADSNAAFASTSSHATSALAVSAGRPAVTKLCALS